MIADGVPGELDGLGVASLGGPQPREGVPPTRVRIEVVRRRQLPAPSGIRLHFVQLPEGEQRLRSEWCEAGQEGPELESLERRTAQPEQVDHVRRIPCSELAVGQVHRIRRDSERHDETEVVDDRLRGLERLAPRIADASHRLEPTDRQQDHHPRLAIVTDEVEVEPAPVERLGDRERAVHEDRSGARDAGRRRGQGARGRWPGPTLCRGLPRPR